MTPLEMVAAEPPTVAAAHDLVELLVRAPEPITPTPGVGHGVRLDFAGLTGTGLAHADETITLTASAG